MLTISRWIHVSSVAMFVGGMTFVFFVLRPALSPRAQEPGMKGTSSFIRARFRLITTLLTGIIVASGVVNIIVAPPRRWYIVLLIFKVLAAGVVFALYFRNAFAKVPGARVSQPVSPLPTGTADTGGPEKVPDWKTTWLLAPTPTQVRMELALIAGAFLVILLGVILASS
jgi:hypothetical protein